MKGIAMRVHIGCLLVLLNGALFSELWAQQCPALVWNDEFDGTVLDDTKWSYQIGDGCDIGLCGWGNNEEQYYKAENVTLSGGIMTITAREERVRSKKYTSARIRTLNKGDWDYGRIEARIKMTYGQGIWPAFWMLPTDEVYGGWPQSGEIDIMENIGSEPATVHGTIHYGDPYPDNQSKGQSFRLHEGVFSDGFHEFAIEKEPGVIRWFVDDNLYQTLTPADIAPANWPFDERFHIIMNVAVGGNWPGSPDNTTVFPQMLDVDYARVYDGNFPHIAGDRNVAHREAGVVYSVGNAFSGSTFTWTVPAGAAIVSGQGTSSITVDWGDTGGDVAVEVASGCGTEQLTMNVKVDPPFSYGFSFENFDEPANVSFNFSTGTLNEVANPDPSGVNTSALSGEYTRNAAETFDVLFYDTASISDASTYATDQKRFYMDVYTAAPVGTLILVQLEDASLATSSNYPTGRHSRYQAFTTVQNQWSRLSFSYLDSPDPDTPDDGIDNIVILFASNTNTGDVYYFDNFDSYNAGVAGGSPPAAPGDLNATAVSSSEIELVWSDNATDEDGFAIERSLDGSSFTEITQVGANTTSYSDAGLSASTTYHYQVRAFNANGFSAYSNISSATTPGGSSATSMHVADIVSSTQNAGQGNKRGTATITIRDDLGGLVSGASVTGTFSGDFNETVSGTTGSDGTVTLVTDGVKKGNVTFSFCVDDVTHSSLTYDSGSNVMTCSSPGKTGSLGEIDAVPDHYMLGQNYPNPFNPTTMISFGVPVGAEVTLKVFNLLGQEVATLADGFYDAGQYEVVFDAYDLSAGIYLYTIQTSEERLTRRMTLLK